MSLVVSPAEQPEPRNGPERALRIGVVAPPWFEIPPRGYGGTEAVVAALVDQLVDRGHEVTLVASGGHRTKAQRFVRVYENPPSAKLGVDALPEVTAAAEAARALDGIPLDLVHDHSLAGPLLARGRREPTVVTLHGLSTGANGDYMERLGRSVDLVAISDSQRRLNPRLNWVATVHNAVDVSSFTYLARKESFVLWLGRFCPDKGAHLAIDAARIAGLRIVLAGKINEAVERDYFERHIAPRLGAGVSYVGEADAAVKRELLSRTRCLLFPIQWNEPFGMVMVEAMACGTPVVAIDRGSVPEVVEHGVTGIVVNRAAQLPEALHRVEQIDPSACRARARRLFDLPVMAAGYERVYRMLVEGAQGIRQLTGAPAEVVKN